MYRNEVASRESVSNVYPIDIPNLINGHRLTDRRVKTRQEVDKTVPKTELPLAS